MQWRGWPLRNTARCAVSRAYEIVLQRLGGSWVKGGEGCTWFGLYPACWIGGTENAGLHDIPLRNSSGDRVRRQNALVDVRSHILQIAAAVGAVNWSRIVDLRPLMRPWRPDSIGGAYGSAKVTFRQNVETTRYPSREIVTCTVEASALFEVFALVQFRGWLSGLSHKLSLEKLWSDMSCVWTKF